MIRWRSIDRKLHNSKGIKEKKLVIGMSPGYFPFDMKDPNGNFVGYDVDIANAIGKALGKILK